MAVLNKHKDTIPPGAVYIGRGSPWGNPFIISVHGDRNEVCDLYQERLEHEIDVGDISLHALADLHGKDLVCFCAPKRCHGHILEKAAQWAVTQIRKQKSQE